MNKLRKRFIDEINDGLLTLAVDIEEDYISKDFMWNIDIAYVNSAIDKIKEILFEEEDAYDSIPISLRGTARADDSAYAIECMKGAVMQLQQAKEILTQWHETKKGKKRTQLYNQALELIKEASEELEEILY